MKTKQSRLPLLNNSKRGLTTHSTGARDSMAFIILPSGSAYVAFARARLIRALYTPESSDMKASTRSYAEPHAAAKRRSNFSFDRSGISLDVIRELEGLIQSFLPGQFGR
jgi:hypothetical protein